MIPNELILWELFYLVNLSFIFRALSRAETVKLIPEHLVTYKVFGERDGPHYAHYDLVGGRMVYKCFPFLNCLTPDPPP